MLLLFFVRLFTRMPRSSHVNSLHCVSFASISIDFPSQEKRWNIAVFCAVPNSHMNSVRCTRFAFLSVNNSSYLLPLNLNNIFNIFFLFSQLHTRISCARVWIANVVTLFEPKQIDNIVWDSSEGRLCDRRSSWFCLLFGDAFRITTEQSSENTVPILHYWSDFFSAHPISRGPCSVVFCH